MDHAPHHCHGLHHGKPGAGLFMLPKFEVDLEDTAGRIRCPFCEWTPDRASKWYCGSCPDPEGLLQGCGTAWNTFDTRGLCPGCRHQWRWTSCHLCGLWSLHEDWYEQDDDGPPA